MPSELTIVGIYFSLHKSQNIYYTGNVIDEIVLLFSNETGIVSCYDAKNSLVIAVDWPWISLGVSVYPVVPKCLVQFIKSHLRYWSKSLRLKLKYWL